MMGSVTRVAGLLLAGYGLVLVLAWRYQDRLAFPAPRARLPAPAEVGLRDGIRVAVTAADAVTLRGWYLPPAAGAPTPAPGLLWFYGNMETIAGIWPVIAAWKPPELGLLVLDFRGYGESDGSATEPGLYLDGEAAWAFLAGRLEIDSTRIAVYGRSLGSAVALHVATTRPARAVVLESAFTSGAAMARRHYWYVPRRLLHLRLDNLGRARALTVPLMVVHGEDDRIAPIAMGREVAGAGRATVFLPIPGAGHNDTFARGEDRYRDAMTAFLRTALR